MKNPIPSLLFVLLLPLPLIAQCFSEIAAKENKIAYGGYEIQTGFNPQTRVSHATISKNGRVLISLGYASFLQHSTRVGQQYTGGAPALDVSNVCSKEEYFSAVLQVVLKYLYAGKAKEAWPFYHNWYKLDDRRGIEADLRKELRTSRIYRSMYPSR